MLCAKLRNCLKQNANLIGRNLSTPIPYLSPNVSEFEVHNEKVYEYLKHDKESKLLNIALDRYKNATVDVPIIIDGEKYNSKLIKHQVSPFDHSKKIAKFYWATSDLIQKAIQKSQEKRREWEKIPLAEKINLFLKAADLVSTKYRYELNAATILGQAKTIIQAEIDSAAELADFFRFNAFFAKELSRYQPISKDKSEVLNTFRFRGIDGFIAAISPFNFTAIGGNLATSPTLMGNVVLWKPSDTAILSNYIIYQLLEETGFPKGVINFLPSEGTVFGNTITSSPHLGGINFTGSVATFKHLWKQVANNLDLYTNFPRLIGECGGKNYHFVHPSANIETVVACTIRSAFEYSGQKCSACSRLYVPESLWDTIKKRLIEETKKLKLGNPLDRKTFLSAVIDENSFKRITSYITYAEKSTDCKILVGGKFDNKVGYFIEPTIILTKNPNDKLVQDELFGPVLIVVVYSDKNINETLNLVDKSTKFALSGSIFSEDAEFLKFSSDYLKMSAGNLYINDKSTGSVVGQQPFGGARLSGTNDKAGGPHYLLRWTSPQNVKETFKPQTEISYSYIDE